MTDQNNLARAYSSDVAEEDPLAELARIVSGQEPLTRKPAVSATPPQHSRPSEPVQAAAAEPPAQPVMVEAPAFDLEDALMAELGFEEARPVVAPVVATAPEPEPEILPEPPQPEAMEAVMPETLEDQLLAELSFDAEPRPAAMPPMSAEPAEIDEPVTQDWEAAEPLDEILLHEQAQPSGNDNVDEFDEFAAILDETHREAPAGPEELAFDQAFEEALAAADGVNAPAEVAAPASQALDTIDFGSAFEAELREMEFAAAPIPAATERRPHVSLATPVAPRREPASERALEDHFAAAFAEELDLGVARALDQGRKPVSAHAAAPMPAAMPAASPSHDPAALNGGFQDVPESWEQEYPLDPGHDGSDDHFDEERVVPPPAGLGRGVKLAAAAIAIAVVIGGGAIAMSFMGGGGPVASGEPVVVKAETDPVKVKPENPGGVEIQNQDQDVYKRVAGAGADGGSQEKLVSASEEPVEIARVAEEQPAAIGDDADPAVAADAVSGEVPLAGDAKADVRLAPASEDVSAAPAALAPRRVKTMLIKPDGTVVPAPAEETVASVEQVSSNVAALAADGASAAAQGVETAVKPVAGAIQAAGTAVATANSAPAQVETAEPSSTAVGSGAWAVQLASQRSAEDAQATFQNLKQKFPSVLDGKPLAVQRAEVEGKGVFYRVRVPTQTKEEAAALCEQLKAAGGSCFIAR